MTYVAPRAEVSFGDIFDTSFMHDVHLREDAILMGSRELPPKLGGGMAYGPMYAGKQRSFVLAHGRRYRAILITDNCVIDTALAQGRQAGSKPKGRLLFAPILPTEGGSGEEVGAFGRFPLPEWEDTLPPGIVELRRCFMVDSRDVAGHIDSRLAALDDTSAEELEIRWNAFAARRGPLAATRNAGKLAGLLARRRGAEEPEESERDLGVAVARVLTTAWRAEGNALENVADAFDGDADGASEVVSLEAELRTLAEEARAAADLLGPFLPAGNGE